MKAALKMKSNKKADITFSFFYVCMTKSLNVFNCSVQVMAVKCTNKTHLNVFLKDQFNQSVYPVTLKENNHFWEVFGYIKPVCE